MDHIVTVSVTTSLNCLIGFSSQFIDFSLIVTCNQIPFVYLEPLFSKHIFLIVELESMAG